MGDTYPKFKAAAIQAAPVFLNREATMEKACRLIQEAAEHGANLIVFPESFIPGYPIWHWWFVRRAYPPIKRLFARLFKNSVDIPGTALEPLCQAARESHAYVVVGVNEREAEYGRGTLYNSILYLSPTGEIMGRHRKLMLTYHERMVWGMGDASDLEVFETDIGRLGGLICWEHWMPLVRYAQYAKGEQVHIALFPARNPELPQLSCRHLAYEGRVFVVSACGYMTRSMLPEDFELAEEAAGWPDPIMRGGSAIIGPDGNCLAGPAGEEETILYADIDLERIIEEKHDLDVVGHYSRPDILRLSVNNR